jgi:hypothetical protein
MTELARLITGASSSIFERRPWLEDGREWINEVRNGKTRRVPFAEHFGHGFRVRFSKEDWISMDMLTVRTFRGRCPFVSKLMQLKLSFGPFPFAAPITEEEREIVDIEARKEMADKHVFELLNPLPMSITWHECKIQHVSELTQLEMSARRVGEKIEQDFLSEMSEKKGLEARSVEAAVQLLHDKNFFGPYLIVKGSESKVEVPPKFDVDVEGEAINIEFESSDLVATPLLPALSEKSCFVLQATPDVVRAVIGLDLTLVCWPEEGKPDAMRVIACIAPQLRMDFHGTLAVVEVK